MPEQKDDCLQLNGHGFRIGIFTPDEKDGSFQYLSAVESGDYMQIECSMNEGEGETIHARSLLSYQDWCALRAYIDAFFEEVNA